MRNKFGQGKLWARFLIWLNSEIYMAVKVATDERDRDEEEAFAHYFAHPEAYTVVGGAEE